MTPLITNRLLIILILLIRFGFAQKNCFSAFSTDKFEIQNNCINYGNSFYFWGYRGHSTPDLENDLWIIKSNEQFSKIQSLNISFHDTVIWPWSAIVYNNEFYIWCSASIKGSPFIPCLISLDTNLSVSQVRYFPDWLSGSSLNIVHLSAVYSVRDSQFVGSIIVEDNSLNLNDYLNNYLFTYKIGMSSFTNKQYDLEDSLDISGNMTGSDIGIWENGDSTHYFIHKSFDFGFSGVLKSFIKFYQINLSVRGEMNIGSIPYITGSVHSFGRIGDYLVEKDSFLIVKWVHSFSSVTVDTEFFFIQKTDLKTGKVNSSQFLKNQAAVTYPSQTISARPAWNKSICKSNDSYFISANYRSDIHLGNKNDSRVVVAKFDTTLRIVWQKLISGKNYYLNGIIPISDGGCAIYGCYKEVDHPENEPDPFLYLIDSSGILNSVWDLVKTNIQFELYPNPSNGILNIRGLGNAIGIKITIRAMDAQEIKSMDYSTSIDVSEIQSGIYIIEIQTETGVVIQKFIKN